MLTHFKSKFSKNFKSSITTPPLLFLPASAPPQFRSSPNFFFNYILEFYKTKTKSYDYSVLFLLSPRLEKRNVRFTFVSPFQKKMYQNFKACLLTTFSVSVSVSLASSPPRRRLCSRGRCSWAGSRGRGSSRGSASRSRPSSTPSRPDSTARPLGLVWVGMGP